MLTVCGPLTLGAKTCQDPDKVSRWRHVRTGVYREPRRSEFRAMVARAAIDQSRGPSPTAPSPIQSGQEPRASIIHLWIPSPHEAIHYQILLTPLYKPNYY